MPTVSITIPNLAVADGKLSSLPGAVQTAIQQGLLAVAMVARNDAVRRVQQGPKTGRVYQLSNPKRTHQASAPGEAPATDLGHLVASIAAEPAPEIGGAILVARAKYAAHLEYGTRRIEPRPFLRPAADVAKEQGPRIMDAYMKRVFPAT